MYGGSLTDIGGIRVGHSTDAVAQTGCTVVLFDGGAVCGVDVRGAAPGTRETDLLRGFNAVECVNAILLTGGSAFGLAAADGVMRHLAQRGMGHVTGEGVVPIVPAAVLYDLSVGSSEVRPDAAFGEAACLQASGEQVEQGMVGAGAGASVGKLLGMDCAMRGGIGSAGITLQNGVCVTALMAVNALGDIVDHRSGEILAGVCAGGSFCNSVNILLDPGAVQMPLETNGGNTTIGVVATNARLNREQANRLALVAHDGLAMTIRPVHTQFDGDTVFGASSGEVAVDDVQLLSIFAAAAEVTARAVVNAVIHANGAPASEGV